MGADLYMELSALEPAFKALSKLEAKIRTMKREEPYGDYTAAGYNQAIDDIADLVKAYHEQISDLGFRQVPYVIP